MEKGLLELRNDLIEAEKSLASLLVEVHVDPSFDHPFGPIGLLDGHSPGFSYPKLRDDASPDEASRLWQKIKALKEKIASFRQDQERETRDQERREQDDENFRRELILGVAKDLYRKYLSEYEKSGIFEKASLFLSGNNPILDSDEEILEVYGKAAVDIILAPALAEIKREWFVQLAGVEIDFGDNSEELARAIKQTNDFFGDKSSRLRDAYEKALSNLLSDDKYDRRR